MPSTLGIVASHINAPLVTITPDKLHVLPGDTITWSVNLFNFAPGTRTLYIVRTQDVNAWTTPPPSTITLTGNFATFTGTVGTPTSDTTQYVTLQLRYNSATGNIAATSPSVARYSVTSNAVTTTNSGTTTTGTVSGIVADGRGHKFRGSITAGSFGTGTLSLRLNGTTFFTSSQASDCGNSNFRTMSFNFVFRRIPPGGVVTWHTSGSLCVGSTWNRPSISITTTSQTNDNFALTG